VPDRIICLAIDRRRMIAKVAEAGLRDSPRFRLQGPSGYDLPKGPLCKPGEWMSDGALFILAPELLGAGAESDGVNQRGVRRPGRDVQSTLPGLPREVAREALSVVHPNGQRRRSIFVRGSVLREGGGGSCQPMARADQHLGAGVHSGLTETYRPWCQSVSGHSRAYNWRRLAPSNPLGVRSAMPLCDYASSQTASSHSSARDRDGTN
jgi:hypothetical protein